MRTLLQAIVSTVGVVSGAFADTVTVDPDDFLPGEPMTLAVPIAVMTVSGGNGAVAIASGYASTGTQTVGRDCSSACQESFVTPLPGQGSPREWRMDLCVMATEVAFDVVNTSDENGAFDAAFTVSATLLSGATLVVSTDVLALGAAERVVLTSAQDPVTSVTVWGIAPQDPPKGLVALEYEIDALAFEIPPFLLSDCDGNGETDICEIAEGSAADCNFNGIPDCCDIGYGFSEDANLDGIPDDCICGCADLVLAIDESGSRIGVIERIKLEIDAFVAEASFRSGGDLRVGLVTFSDGIVVHHPLTTDLAAVQASIENIVASGGGDFPERSDEALREILHGASACVDDGDFDTPFRSECLRSIVIITDTVPSGCNDMWDEGVDDVNAHQLALDAAALGVRIHGVFVPNGFSPPELAAAGEAVLVDYATTTGGLAIRTHPSGSGIVGALRATVNSCGDCNGNGIPDIDDIASGRSMDVNGNGAPDECDEASGVLDDCNGNGIPDGCDIEFGLTVDANFNSIPDECEGRVLYVNAGAAGPIHNGATWETAYTDLQDALVTAGTSPRVNEIWVAAGTYRPDRGTGSRIMSFFLPSGVAVYGGFAGGEASVSERDPTTNIVVLSADIGTAGDDADNSYHVIQSFGATGAVLDGMTIADGNADGPGFDALGGGAFVSGDVSFVACTFSNCLADFGGGLFVMSSEDVVDLVACSFENNTAQSSGGGLYLNGVEASLVGCKITSNTAEVAGGGLYGDRVSASSTTFENNATVSGEGGGVHVYGASSFVDCLFESNSAGWEGGGLSSNGAPVTVTTSTFLTNFATTSGGGARNVNAEGTVYQACLFDSNQAADWGGGLYVFSAEADVLDCTVMGNTGNFGGGLFTSSGSTGRIVESDFVGNTAATSGGAGFMNDGTSFEFESCVLSGNTAAFGGGLFNDGASTLVRDSAFMANQATTNSGGAVNNLNGTPMLVDCLIDGNTAMWGGGVFNQGENQAELVACTIVNNSADVDGGGVMVVAGSPVIRACDLMDNVAGDDAGGMMLSGGSPIIRGSSIVGNESGDAGGGVLSQNANTLIADCTIESNVSVGVGGGLALFGTGDVDIVSTDVRGNHATLNGGGAYLNGPDPTFTNCVFDANISEITGGAIRAFSASSPSLVHCTIVGNVATTGGGVAINGDGSALVLLVDNTIVRGNAPGQVTLQGAGDVADIRYSNIEGGFAGVGNIDADPLFEDRGAGDYRLASGSPCIDAADAEALPADVGDADGDGDVTEALPRDRLGLLRSVDDPAVVDSGSGMSPLPDIGAFEFQACPADVDASGAVDVSDILSIVGAWGTSDPVFDIAPPGGDGVVDVADLLALVGVWGPCR